MVAAKAAGSRAHARRATVRGAAQALRLTRPGSAAMAAALDRMLALLEAAGLETPGRRRRGRAPRRSGADHRRGHGGSRGRGGSRDRDAAGWRGGSAARPGGRQHGRDGWRPVRDGALGRPDGPPRGTPDPRARAGGPPGSRGLPRGRLGAAPGGRAPRGGDRCRGTRAHRRRRGGGGARRGRSDLRQRRRDRDGRRLPARPRLRRVRHGLHGVCGNHLHRPRDGAGHGRDPRGRPSDARAPGGRHARRARGHRGAQPAPGPRAGGARDLDRDRDGRPPRPVRGRARVGRGDGVGEAVDGSRVRGPARPARGRRGWRRGRGRRARRRARRLRPKPPSSASRWTSPPSATRGGSPGPDGNRHDRRARRRRRPQHDGPRPPARVPRARPAVRRVRDLRPGRPRVLAHPLGDRHGGRRADRRGRWSTAASRRSRWS